MRELISNFPNQLSESIAISEGYDIELTRTVNKVVICGLGGSGIGGEIIKKWVAEESTVPVELCHNYKLPGYVDSATLVISCSYSGNTEETLAAFSDALKLNAQIIGITSGGKLEEGLIANNKTSILIPGGLPPRSALAYSLVQLARIFQQVNFIKSSIIEEISESVDLLRDEQSKICMLAKQLLEIIGSKRLMLYAEEVLSPVLLRGCQQINENSKELCFYNVIPEMNHNEIVGWAKDPKDIFALFLRSNLEHSQNSKRLNITTNIISDRTDSRMSISALGSGLVQQTLYFIHLLDWLSLLMAEKKNIDVVEVEVIDFLKDELAKN